MNYGLLGKYDIKIVMIGTSHPIPRLKSVWISH